jgi:hypothetical protein
MEENVPKDVAVVVDVAARVGVSLKGLRIFGALIKASFDYYKHFP